MNLMEVSSYWCYNHKKIYLVKCYFWTGLRLENRRAVLQCSLESFQHIFPRGKSFLGCGGKGITDLNQFIPWDMWHFLGFLPRGAPLASILPQQQLWKQASCISILLCCLSWASKCLRAPGLLSSGSPVAPSLTGGGGGGGSRGGREGRVGFINREYRGWARMKSGAVRWASSEVDTRLDSGRSK